jgi:TM2 domain-containing membrane protein YozV
MDQQFMMATAGLTHEEVVLLEQMSVDLTEQEKNQFLMFYRGDRKEPQTVLILAILGLVSIAGIHRFLLGQILMGLLYLCTAGLCFVGTIIDIVKHKEMTFDYNRKAAINAYNRVKGGGSYNSQQFV